MSNRYVEEVDPNGYDEILQYCPGKMLWNVVAEEVARRCHPNSTIIDLGAGQGHSAIPIIRAVGAKIILVDNSDEMLSEARLNINNDPVISHIADPDVEYVNKDIFDYLYDDIGGPCLLTSSWTIHNFTPEERSRLFGLVVDYLRRAKSNTFVYMDKVHRDGPEEEQLEALNRQIQLYSYIRNIKNRKDIVEHEKEDYKRRMEESETLRLLQDSGFKTAYVAARIERDVVIICTL